MTAALCNAMCEVVELAFRLGVRNLKDLPGCWEYDVDPHWWIAVNGHKTATKCSRGTEVEPYGCYVEFNGWPAGTFNPYGGCLAAGSDANEESFVEAVRGSGRRGT